MIRLCVACFLVVETTAIFRRTTCLAGLESGRIQNKQLTATSQRTDFTGPSAARFRSGRRSFNGTGPGWQPATKDAAEYLQIDLGRPLTLLGFSFHDGLDSDSTQVSSVLSFSAYGSVDGISYRSMSLTTSAIISTSESGNDRVATVRNAAVQFIRLSIRSYTGSWPTLRVEVSVRCQLSEDFNQQVNKGYNNSMSAADFQGVSWEITNLPALPKDSPGYILVRQDETTGDTALEAFETGAAPRRWQMALATSISSVRPSPIIVEVDYDSIGTFEADDQFELWRITDAGAIAVPTTSLVLSRVTTPLGQAVTRRRLVARLEVTSLQLQVRIKVNTPTHHTETELLQLRNILVVDDFSSFNCFEELANPGVLGSDYRGRLNTTASGYTCQAWAAQVPHAHTTTPNRYPTADLVSNYCRNPIDGRPATGPWCFTTENTQAWEACAVCTCPPLNLDASTSVVYCSDGMNTATPHTSPVMCQVGNATHERAIACGYNTNIGLVQWTDSLAEVLETDPTSTIVSSPTTPTTSLSTSESTTSLLITSPSTTTSSSTSNTSSASSILPSSTDSPTTTVSTSPALTMPSSTSTVASTLSLISTSPNIPAVNSSSSETSFFEDNLIYIAAGASGLLLLLCLLVFCCCCRRSRTQPSELQTVAVRTPVPRPKQRHYARWTFTPQPSSPPGDVESPTRSRAGSRARVGSKSGARFKDVHINRAVWRTRTRQAWNGSFGDIDTVTIVTVTTPKPNQSHLHLLTVGKRLGQKCHPYVDRLVQLFNSGIEVKGTPSNYQLVKLQDRGPTALFQSPDPSATPFALFIKSPQASCMSMPERVQMLACLASALSYLEKNGCCHALLQPSLVVISETQGPIVQGVDSCLAMMQRPASPAVTIRMEPSYVSGRLAQLKAVHSWATPRYYSPELLLSPSLELDELWPYSATFGEGTLEGMHAYSWASLAIYALAGAPPGDGLTNESFLLQQRISAVPRLPFEQCTDDLMDVLELCLQLDPTHRPRIETILHQLDDMLALGDTYATIDETIAEMTSLEPADASSIGALYGPPVAASSLYYEPADALHGRRHLIPPAVDFSEEESQYISSPPQQDIQLYQPLESGGNVRHSLLLAPVDGHAEGTITHLDWSPYEEISQEEISQIASSFRSRSSTVWQSPADAGSAGPVSERTTDIPELTKALKDFELDPSQLTKQLKIGEGSFGQVFRAMLKSAPPVPVAIKTLHSSPSVAVKQDFLLEAFALAQFDHPNVLRLIGVVLNGNVWSHVTEMMQYGDLKGVVSLCKEFDIVTNALEQLHWLAQAAAGMRHLADQHFVHRDLALRNILLGANNVVKISDMGHTRLLEEDVYSTKSQARRLPVRWMAPETFQSQRFTTASDVYSFGVVFYELVTKGKTPWYQLKDTSEVVEAVMNGRQLVLPQGADQGVTDLIKRCWDSDPSARPSFKEIFGLLKQEVTQLETDGILAQRDIGVLLAQKRLAYRSTLKRRSARLAVRSGPVERAGSHAETAI
eukprot:m.71526 g.71526  ORF g.71526 m.71526 type:complete len:1506 (+) comp14220_c0_seq1:47-4564(+)